jgi:hypothetical protein
MFTFASVYLTILGWIIWTVILGGLIWAPKLAHADQKYTCPLVIGLRGLLFSVFTYWALISFDSLIKILFLGQIGYGNIGYYLFPVFLALISGILILIGSVFVAPTRKTILGFIFILIVFGYYIWGIGNSNLPELGSLFIPLVSLLVFEVILTAIYLFIRLIFKNRKIEDTPLWDISEKYKAFFRPKLILAFWIMYSIEIFLLFGGYSIFAFGSGSENLYQILIDLAILSGYIMWFLVDRIIQKNRKEKTVSKPV